MAVCIVECARGERLKILIFNLANLCLRAQIRGLREEREYNNLVFVQNLDVNNLDYVLK